ncbi:DUF6719 family protein [Bradyrhizobium sp. WSM3983]|uniref:DUF6719 family protein n=1 Tax=Bradyrhizobium sp. WSM3983 TaxID=1038867 RepID=UPI0003FC50F8|nr:DUF6719 family protein [Bradyrhizobium sp. WSM3983]
MSLVTTLGRATFGCAACLALLISTALATTARAGTLGREQDIVDLKLGQRVQVDDGTCPAGQIKEVRGAKMTDKGVSRTATCVARFGPKSR